jgi:hypothetical protein
MAKRAILAALSSVVLLAGLVGTASAQDAAETAIILGGTGQAQVGASRSLGAAISNGLNGATNTINAATPDRGAGHGSSAATGHARPVGVMIGSSTTRDPLAGTDAPTYRLANGSSIRVSGGLIPSAEANCVKDCR